MQSVRKNFFNNSALLLLDSSFTLSFTESNSQSSVPWTDNFIDARLLTLPHAPCPPWPYLLVGWPCFFLLSNPLYQWVLQYIKNHKVQKDFKSTNTPRGHGQVTLGSCCPSCLGKSGSSSARVTGRTLTAVMSRSRHTNW